MITNADLATSSERAIQRAVDAAKKFAGAEDVKDLERGTLALAELRHAANCSMDAHLDGRLDQFKDQILERLWVTLIQPPASAV